MDFVTIRELRAEGAKIWEKLDQGQEIVLTRNGKPFAVLFGTRPEDIEDVIGAVRTERLAIQVRKTQRMANFLEESHTVGHSSGDGSDV